MAKSSNMSTMTMSNVASRNNTDSPHPVGSNAMGSAGMIRDRCHRGTKGLGLGDSPVLALQRLVHRLVGDLTTSHPGNSHSVSNNTGVNNTSTSHNTTMAKSSNKSSMTNSSDKTPPDKTSSNDSWVDCSHKS